MILLNEPRYPKRFSDNAKDFISQLLKTDAEDRLGYRGFEMLKSHSFFSTEDKNKGIELPSWKQVSSGETQQVVYLSEAGIVGKPEDAVFFHSEYTSIDVKEYIPAMKNPLHVEEFVTVNDSLLENFASLTPIPVDVEKNDQRYTKEDNELKKG